MDTPTSHAASSSRLPSARGTNPSPAAAERADCIVRQVEEPGDAVIQPREEHPSLPHGHDTGAAEFEWVPLPCLAVDSDGKITAVNSSATRLFGRSREQLIQTYFKDHVESGAADEFSQQLGACRTDFDARTFESSIVSTTRGIIPVQLSCKRSPPRPGQASAVQIAIADVSELKRVQDELRETNAEQEAFAYSISHDLRAPLITITNYSEFLATEMREQLDATALDVLGRIQRAAQRMDSVLQNLLVYSRVSRSQLTVAPVDLGSLVTELLIQHHGLIQDSGASIHLQPGLPKAQGSRELLGQVLGNLLTNALKYTAPGKSPVVRFTGEQRGAHVVITVEDEGIGIAADDQERIFRMFERLHGQSTYPGTGIGLAVVQRAVERMSGRIWVESELGRGSKFHVQLRAPEDAV